MMQKSMKYFYTGLLGAACLIFSPLIAKQIWNSSTDKTVDAAACQVQDIFQEETVLDTECQYSFSQALQALQNNQKVTRCNWDEDIWLQMITPENTIADMEIMPYIVMKTENNKLVPWLAKQEDILAEDWLLLSETNETAYQIAN